MMRLVGAELCKAWRNRVFVMTLVGLLCANLFLLWVSTNPVRGADTAHAYHVMNAALTHKTMAEKSAFIKEELHRVEGLHIVSGILRNEAYNGGKKDSAMRERYAAEMTEFYDLYKAGGTLQYTDNLSNEYLFLKKIEAECSTVAGYDAFLDSVSEKATQLSGISIFAESADGYDMANIDATAKAYEGMRGGRAAMQTPVESASLSPVSRSEMEAKADKEGIAIDYAPQMGIYTALDFALTDVVAVFAMLLIATVLVRGERDNGLLALMRTAPAGRLKTAVAKLLALAVSLFVMLILLYGVNLAYCGAVYGLGDFSRNIQSVPALMRSTLKLNVGQYLNLFLLTKWAAALVAGVWVMLMMLSAKRAFAGTFGALALLCANLLIRSIIPATSKLNVIKYANLVSLLRTNELIGGYRNLYWFGAPIPLVLVESMTALVCGAVFIFAFCSVFAKAALQPAGHGFAMRLPRFLRRKQGATKPTTVMRQEAHKLFFMNGAAVILALFCAFQVDTALTTESYIDADEIYYRYYMRHMEGPVTQEKIDWLKAQRTEFAPIYKLQAEMRANKITPETYQSLLMGYGGLQQKMAVFERVLAKFDYFKMDTHPRAQFVYETGWLALFDMADTHDAMDTLLAALLCALCFSGFCAMEIQSGMEKVIRATPLGRSYTAKCKLRLTTFVCMGITALSVLPRFWTVLRDYGLGAFFAPTYSMMQFDGMLEIPLFFMLFLWVAARFVAVRAIAGATLALSYRLGNFFAALFAASIAFSLPLLLSISGIKNAKWLSVYPLFHAAALFNHPADAIAVCGYAFIFGMSIGITDYMVTESFAATEPFHA